jgi:putative zinc finger/helix-turn-helix YgiT family protein
MVCPQCGEAYLSAETVRAMERLVAESLARSGEGTPEAFRFMRKALGLKATQVSKLFGVTPETISRWEHGERNPEPRAVKLLGALVVEHLAGRDHLLDYLQSLDGVRPAAEAAGVPARERQLVFPAPPAP